MIVGLTGPNAAGKGEVARFLVEEGFAYYSLSDVVREEATARGLDHSRENLILVGNDLRARFGAGVLAERIAAKIDQEFVAKVEEAYERHVQDRAGEKAVIGEAELPNIVVKGWVAQGPARRGAPAAGRPTVVPVTVQGVVDSIRSPAEVAVLRRLSDFLLLGVDAPIAVRFERAKARGRIGDGASLDEFVRKEGLENSNDPAAQQLVQTLSLADAVIENAGTLEELRANVAAAVRLPR